MCIDLGFLQSKVMQMLSNSNENDQLLEFLIWMICFRLDDLTSDSLVTIIVPHH